MKKIFLLSSAFLAMVLILAGCAKKVPATQQSGQANGGPERMRIPDFGQPDRVPDIRGVVKSIVGNEVVALKIDMPAGGMRATSTPQGENASSSGSRDTVNLVGGAERQGGRMMAGGPGGPGEQNSETRAQMLEKLKAMSTGEEKIIIPVGIQMMKFDTSSGKRTAVEASLADITADKNITVWVSGGTGAEASATSTAATPKIAEFVLIN